MLSSESLPGTLYWRPGCPYCSRLQRKLARAGVRLEERNIWADAEAAARLRAITGGDETVPTLVLGKEALVNPSPRRALAAVAARADQGRGSRSTPR